MRKYLSVFNFYVCQRAKSNLLILLFLSVFNLAGFYGLGFMRRGNFDAGSSCTFLAFLFFIAYTLIFFYSVTMAGKKSHPGLLIERLKVSEREVFFLEALANMLFFFLLLFTEMITVGILLILYMNAATYTHGPQGMVVALYRDSFLHGLIPLKEYVIYVRNIFFVISSGFATAWISMCNRKGKNIAVVFVFYSMLVLSFKQGLLSGYSPLTSFFAFLICLAFVYDAFKSAHPGRRRK